MAQNVSQIVLRLSHEPLKVHDWFAFNAAGEQTAHQLAANQHWPLSAQLDLAIPAAWLTAHRLAMPKVNEKQRQQLISQALEDRVLGRLADYHWQASRTHDGFCTVWVIAKSKLDQLKAWAAAQQINANRWIPEFALLGEQADCMLAGSSGVIARLGDDVVCLADEAELLAISHDRSVTALATAQRPSEAAVSFFRGKSAGVSLQFSWSDWRWSVYLVGVCLAIMLLSLILQWRSLANRETALRQEIRQTFASIYPGVPIVDPMLQWQSMQKQGGSVRSGDALDLLYRSAAQMAGEFGAHSIQVKDNTVTLILPATQGAALAAKLNAQGAKVRSTTLADGRMNLELAP